MAHLREKVEDNVINHNQVDLNDISSFEIEENNWMIWASWGLIFSVPIISLMLLTSKYLIVVINCFF